LPFEKFSLAIQKKKTIISAFKFEMSAAFFFLFEIEFRKTIIEQ